jgi:hypothetical protein
VPRIKTASGGRKRNGGSAGQIRARKKKFIAALKAEYNISRAADVAGVHRNSYYDWRRTDPDFAAEADAVIEAVTDNVEQALANRASEGKDVTAMIFWLKCRRRAVFGDNVKHDVDGKLIVQFEDVTPDADDR